MPLTHHERSKKFSSSQYGTTAQRVAGDSLYNIGSCGLSSTSLYDAPSVLCSPSGYCYAADAILAYLVEHTQALKAQRAAYEAQQQAAALANDEEIEAKRKAIASFEQSQQVVSKRPKTTTSAHAAAQADLKRTSYWLADAQPEAVKAPPLEEPPARPASPHSGQPLRRKELWNVHLMWSDDAAAGDNDKTEKKSSGATRNPPTLLCSVSHKALHNQAVTAYWTKDKSAPGQVVLSDVYETIVKPDGVCPQSGLKIRATRTLQRAGQVVEAKQYRPTIT